MIALDGAATIGSTRRDLARIFAQAGKDSPDLDARLLVGHALGLDHTALVADPHRALSQEQRIAIERLAERRLAGEPIARILGRREFWGLPLKLSKATLVPRPDTETVVEAVLDVFSGRRGEALRIVDLGTGTGALLLALLHEFRSASGIGTDLDPQALETAQENARALGLADRAHFTRCDFGADPGGAFDVVVSNPPYIPTSEIAALDVEVREHDPKLALDGGADGLDAYRAIAGKLGRWLAADGCAVLEIGIGQAKAVGEILQQAGFPAAAIRSDLGGIPRVLIVRRSRQT